MTFYSTRKSKSLSPLKQKKIALNQIDSFVNVIINPADKKNPFLDYKKENARYRTTFNMFKSEVRNSPMAQKFIKTWFKHENLEHFNQLPNWICGTLLKPVISPDNHGFVDGVQVELTLKIDDGFARSVMIPFIPPTYLLTTPHQYLLEEAESIMNLRGYYPAEGKISDILAEVKRYIIHF